jgi:hypothetical protein
MLQHFWQNNFAKSLLLGFLNMPAPAAKLKTLALTVPSRWTARDYVGVSATALDGEGLILGLDLACTARNDLDTAHRCEIDHSNWPSLITGDTEFTIGKPAITGQDFAVESTSLGSGRNVAAG